MSGDSLLSDELLQQLIAVGHVDVLVCVPTLNNAATVGQVVRAIHTSFATDFRRERTVLINADGGSSDGSPDIVRQASLQESETVIARDALRTIHRISVPYHGLPGKGGALRTLFAAAELLQARAVALFDADVTNIAPDWVGRLVRPVLEGRADYVAPVFSRHPLDGPLVSQLLRPMVRAAYGRRARAPLASEFACSGVFASLCLGQDVWERPFLRHGIDLWLTAMALTGGFRSAEAPFGALMHAPRTSRPGLPEVFGQLLEALFACLEMHESHWLSARGSEPLPSLGTESDSLPEAPPVDPAPLAESFRSGVRALAPVFAKIFGTGTLSRIEQAAQAEGSAIAYPDDLWTATVYEAAIAHHRGVMHREHLIRALVPLYLGRAASFFTENAGREPGLIEERLEALCLQYESAKPAFVERWTSQT